MSDTTKEDQAAKDREQAAAAVLPVLASLDQQATALEQASDKGEQITQGSVVSYELAAQHAKHLIDAGGLSADDIKATAAEHGGAQARAAAERALDHTTHTRSYEPTPTEQEIEEEREIAL